MKPELAKLVYVGSPVDVLASYPPAGSGSKG